MKKQIPLSTEDFGIAQETQPIENLIFEIRGRQVMLDRDLAMLYGVETKRLNEQVFAETLNDSLKISCFS